MCNWLSYDTKQNAMSSGLSYDTKQNVVVDCHIIPYGLVIGRYINFTYNNNNNNNNYYYYYYYYYYYMQSTGILFGAKQHAR